MPMKNYLQFHLTLDLLAAVCVVTAVAILVFLLYVLPYLLFGFVYSVPTIIHQLSYWLTKHYDLDGMLLILTLIMPFLLTAIVLFYLSWRIAYRVEGSVLRGRIPSHRLVGGRGLGGARTKEPKPFFPILTETMIIIVVLVILFIIEYLIILDMTG